jgi:hypothetical protein
MACVPWGNETERADYYKQQFETQLAICQRLEKEIDELKHQQKVELSEGCKECVHSSVCYEIENLKSRKDFIWYQAESGCPHNTRTPKERGGEK